MEPSCLLGLANSHLLLESCAEGLQIRFEESNVSAHHAEMGNLFSLYPKIHCLNADAEVNGCVPNGKRKLFWTKNDIRRPFMVGANLGEVLSHALL